MFVSYRELFARAGALRLFVSCVVSWLGYCGYTLAMVLTVHAVTQSFAQAGICAGGLTIGTGILAPARGRWVHAGGARTLCALAAAHAAAGALLLVGLRAGGLALGMTAAVLLGASSPPLIAVVRAQWSELAGDSLAQTAHAVNAAISDVAQLASPALVAAISIAVSPQMAFAALIGAVVLAAGLVAQHLGRAGDPDDASPHEDGACSHLLRRSAGLRTLMLSGAAMSAWIAGLEIFATSVAARHGLAALGAIPIAASAFGSITTSLAVGARLSGSSPSRRYLAGLLIGAGALPLTLVTSTVAGITVVFVVAGAGFGLINVALYQLIDVVSPARRSIETFNWLASVATAGSAAGAALTGRLVQTTSVGASLFLVALAATAALVVLIRRTTLDELRGCRGR